MFNPRDETECECYISYPVPTFHRVGSFRLGTAPRGRNGSFGPGARTRIRILTRRDKHSPAAPMAGYTALAVWVASNADENIYKFPVERAI